MLGEVRHLLERTGLAEVVRGSGDHGRLIPPGVPRAPEQVPVLARDHEQRRGGDRREHAIWAAAGSRPWPTRTAALHGSDISGEPARRYGNPALERQATADDRTPAREQHR